MFANSFYKAAIRFIYKLVEDPTIAVKKQKTPQSLLTESLLWVS